MGTAQPSAARRSLLSNFNLCRRRSEKESRRSARVGAIPASERGLREVFGCLVLPGDDFCPPNTRRYGAGCCQVSRPLSKPGFGLLTNPLEPPNRATLRDSAVTLAGTAAGTTLGSCRNWELQSCLSIPIRPSRSFRSRKHLSG